MSDQQTTEGARLMAGMLEATGNPKTAAMLRAQAAEIERLRADVAALRLTLGGRTFGPEPVEPIGCPAPGACVQVAEIGRLRSIIRVNGLRAGATHAEIDEVLYAKR